jgi:hypothetical protein
VDGQVPGAQFVGRSHDYLQPDLTLVRQDERRLEDEFLNAADVEGKFGQHRAGHDDGSVYRVVR